MSQITPPPMPEPEGTFVVLGRAEAYYESTGQFTADQLAARDQQWLAIVKEAVERDRAKMCALISDDSSAATYQSIGQYRSALLRYLTPPSPPQ